MPKGSLPRIATPQAGAIAAAVTNPLDVIKTSLQTHHLSLAGAESAAPAAGLLQPRPLAYSGVLQACTAIFREAGAAGFFRGVHARMLVHAPSVAICWTTYEAVKRLLDGAVR